MAIDYTTTDKPVSAELLLIPPLLALSTTLIISFTAGLMFLFLFAAIAVSVSLLRHFISWRLRIPFLLLIIATWISLFEMVLMVYFYGLREQFGVYLPLLACNSLVFSVAEEYYLRLPLRLSLQHAVRTGLVIFLLFVTTGTFRELLAFGSLGTGMTWTGSALHLDPHLPDTVTGLAITRAAPGAFLCLGLLIALWNYCTGRYRGARQQPA
ncbi:MAG: electron transport complex subunit RsxE [Gammaproteobacteria bacterium]|nr:electron transport complex subunit RsxE [Gammaproteobacteria bacterium]